MRQILETMLPQVHEIITFGANQARRRPRQQHLAPMARRHQPGRAIYLGPEIVAISFVSDTRVQAHPHTDRDALRPSLIDETCLSRCGGTYRSRRRCRERRRERISRGREHIAVVTFDRAVQNLVVTGHGLPHHFRLLLPQTGRAHHVAEQECDRPRGM